MNREEIEKYRIRDYYMLPVEVVDNIFYSFEQEIKKLKEKLDKYENPEDMTLMYMWCTEKVKDENKQLKEKIDKAIEHLEKLSFINETTKNRIFPLSNLEMTELYIILKGDSNE